VQMQIPRRGHARQHEGNRGGHTTILPVIKQFRRLTAAKKPHVSDAPHTNYRRSETPENFVFDDATVEHLLATEAVAPSGAACLALACQNRAALLP